MPGETTSNIFIPNAINSALSGAGNLQVIIPCQGKKTARISAIWDASLTATWALWTSGNYIDPGNGSAAGIAAAEARADWNVLALPALTNPAASASESAIFLTLSDAAFRLRLTFVSGGPANVRVHVNMID